MSWEIIFVSVLLVAALITFIIEKMPVDVTALWIITVIAIVSLTTGSERLPNMDEILVVFANSAPLTIVGMFIVCAALEKCGAIESIADVLERISHLRYEVFLLIFTLIVTVLSAFTNNTPVVIVFLPVVMALSRKMKIPASKFLIPLSFAAVFGGCCTTIGTSTNILVSGVLEKYGMKPLAMFELTLLGLPIAIIGCVYLAVFLGGFFPQRETITSMLSEEERKEYITEAYVKAGSQLVGKTISETGLLQEKGIRIIEVVRNGVVLEQELSDIVLEEKDWLVMACRASAVVRAHQMEGIIFEAGVQMGLAQMDTQKGEIVEAVIGPGSSLVGKTVKQVRFLQRYKMVVLAIHRRGANLRNKLENVRFEFGDTLLLLGSESAIENLRGTDDMILLDRHLPAADMRKKMPIVVSVLVGIVALASFEFVPIVAAVIVGVTILFFTDCIRPKEGYNSIEWRVLVLIYGTLVLGSAMDKSGFSALLGQGLVDFGNAFVPFESRPYFLLAALYVATCALTEVLSNNACAVLMTPLAISVGLNLGVDPRPFIIAVTIASSAAFATPIGYQTNTYVYGLGGYKFKDFLRIGLPLNFLYFFGSMAFIPYFWKF